MIISFFPELAEGFRSDDSIDFDLCRFLKMHNASFSLFTKDPVVAKAICRWADAFMAGFGDSTSTGAKLHDCIDVMAYAWAGTRSFESTGAIKSFRVVAGLYAEAVQLVTMNPNIKSVADLAGKTVAVSGFGNVAWGIVTKLAELGAKAVTLSGPDGYIYDPEGITTKEKIDYMLEMRASGRNRVQDYADKFGVEFFPKQKPWGVKADILMPCATQNEVGMKGAEQIVANGVKYYVEVSNMPTTNEAVAYLKANGVIVAPSKAVNAGGVAVSGLEMSQNSMRYGWTFEEVDDKLKNIMKDIFAACDSASKEFGLEGNYMAGANIAGFLKVAEAMKAQGCV